MFPPLTPVMSSKRAREPGSDDENEHGSRKRTPVPSPRPHHATHHHHYHGPINNITQANNANLGISYGPISQTSYSPPLGARPPANLVSLLNPILDASHTRNLKVSPPHSKCFDGTRQEVIGMVLSCAKAPLEEDRPHILWIYGYAGCGKSAISQAVAELLYKEGRLAASFFFFRGSGDRCKIFRLVNSLAHQLARTRPDTAAIIEEVATADHGLLSLSTSSLVFQFEELVLKPIAAIRASLRHGPIIIVLDGVDECEDKEEVAILIENLIAFFNKDPLFPLRLVIASRVEDHIHRELHSSSQVQLLDLVGQTSDMDIETALDVSIAKEMRGAAMRGIQVGSWPSWEDKWRLVQCIGRSYIFMTTIIKLLFAPSTKDGLTPMERLPQILEMKPNFDDLYREILEPCIHFPFFLEILTTVALAFEPLSIAQIAELLDIKTFKVTNVLINLHAIMQVPGDDRSPVTLWHTSLRDFLTEESRAGPLFAGLRHHKLIAKGAIRIATSSSLSESHRYARNYGMDHLFRYLQTVGQGMACYDGVLKGIMPDLLQATFQDDQTALEVACRAKEWKLVHALVNAGANVDTRFQGRGDNVRVALHAACHYEAKEMVYFLLEKGADPNVLAAGSSWAGWGQYAFPLAWAAAEGDVDLVNRLLACGADPNLEGGWFGSALHARAREGKVEVARILLERGADPNVQDHDGWTSLHLASGMHDIGVVKCLLDFKANPNLKNNDGWTPLHRACFNGHLEVAEYLLDHNADPSIRDNKGETALRWAQRRGKQDVVDILTQRGITE